MWPFKRKKKPSYSQADKKDIEKMDDYLTIHSIDFFGPSSKSPNGRYTLAWSDFDKASGRGGARDKGEGRFVLLEEDKLLLQGTMQRPNDGQVADNGTFVLNDWMFGDELQGTFYAIDKQGNTLVIKFFEANLLSNGVSPSGGFAVCQNAHSDSDDSGMLSFFDLRTGSLLWSKEPERGWPDSFEFDVEKNILYLCYENSGRLAYRFSGELLDKES